MKIVSWNVNGIRAAFKKGFADAITTIAADIICLQETKAQDDQVQDTIGELDNYQVFSNSALRKGYSGTTILTRPQPLSVTNDIGSEEHDQEGRVITAEYDDYYLIDVYVPNSGSELLRLDYRQKWDCDFLSYIKRLEEKKPVIACGDFNVAHQPIDLARPKPNYNKTAGYTQVEIDGFSKFANGGLVDSFRALHPDTVAYSWWSYRANARAKNIGWRIDYCLVNATLMPRVENAFILPEVFGSDHCPVGIEI